jgi:hypothetical protein
MTITIIITAIPLFCSRLFRDPTGKGGQSLLKTQNEINLLCNTLPRINYLLWGNEQSIIPSRMGKPGPRDSEGFRAEPAKLNEFKKDLNALPCFLSVSRESH